MSNMTAVNAVNPNALSLVALDAQTMVPAEETDPAADPLGPADPSFTTMSPETLLAFCQMQLGGLDSQITDQMNTQQTALREREAVDSAQDVLDSFGSAGPQTPDDMNRCVTAINGAIAQLPAGDPVANQLTSYLDTMTTTYDFHPGRPLTDDENKELAQDQGVPNLGASGGAAAQAAYADAQSDIGRLTAITTGTFTKPDANTSQWQGTTEALDNLSKDIASGAEVQLLKLQDLVSQRQQAVQLVTGMMTKADETLEDQAKAVGQ
jgi:hypothetical protein